MKPFQTILVLVSVGIYYYVFRQTVHDLDLNLIQKIFAGLALSIPFFLFLIQPLYFWTRKDRNDSGIFYLLQRSIHFVLPYLNYLFFGVLIRDLISLATFWLSPPIFSYNAFESLILVILPVVLFLIGHSVVLRGPQVISHELKSKKISHAWKDFQVLQISDLHLGASNTVGFIRKMVSKVNALDADVIVFTGDLFDGTEEGMRRQFDELKKIKAKESLLFCTGNHEYYWSYEKLASLLDEVGMTWLNNSQVEIKRGHEKMSFFGVPDPQAQAFGHEGPNWEKLELLFDPHEYRVLLSHQPRYFDEAAKRGFDLQLSGHTHGGQFFPWNFLIHFFHKYSKGIYRIGDAVLNVNQGTAHWGPPDRLGTKCEITRLTFVPAVIS